MVKLLKPGRIVLVTAGRFAGRKAVVVMNTDSGTKEKPFGHALVAGVDRPPKKVHKRMSKKKIERRCSVKAFIKSINYNHLLPTRYTVQGDFDPKSCITEVTEDCTKRTMKTNLAKMFKEKFLNPTSEKTGKVSKDLLFLRKKLRF